MNILYLLIPIVVFGGLGLWEHYKMKAKFIKNNESSEEELYKKEILSYYEKFDYIYDISPNGHEKPKPENFLYTFLGLPNKKEAAIFKGKIESEEELEEEIHLVERIKLKNLLANTNPEAEVRRREVEGAKTYCELQNSNVEKERQRKFHEKTELDRLEALPCDMVERTTNRINNRSKKLQKTYENLQENDNKSKNIEHNNDHSPDVEYNIERGEGIKKDVEQRINKKLRGAIERIKESVERRLEEDRLRSRGKFKGYQNKPEDTVQPPNPFDGDDLNDPFL